MSQPRPEISIAESKWESIAGVRRFSHEAMATVFEVLVLHDDARYAEQAAWAGFDELDKLDAELSRFIENSDISRINNSPVGQVLRIGAPTFECLQISKQMHEQTNGAFDITIGSPLACWLNRDKTVRTPTTEELKQARQRTGMSLLKLDEAEQAVQLTGPVQIDLGGIGKGYAVDKIAELLRDWDIDTALVHGGYSTVFAMGLLPATGSNPKENGKTSARAGGWPVTLSSPSGRSQTLAYVHLQSRALSGSGLQKGRHIIDPRTAKPVAGKTAAWAGAPTATVADALSTAFMIMSPDELNRYCFGHSDTLAMVITDGKDTKAVQDKILRYGPWEKYT